MTTAGSTQPQLPFTRLALAVSALVQIIFGGVGLFFVDLWNSFFWTAPLPPVGHEIMHFASVTYLGTAIAALYALSRGTWESARTYFAFSFPYIIFSVIVALFTASNPGVPTIMWLYVALSAIYLPVVIYVWISQSRSQ